MNARDYARRVGEGKPVVLGGYRQNYDDRFQRPVADAVLRTVRSLPVGSTVDVREVTFTKIGRYVWANDFRGGLTDRMVASCIGEGENWMVTVPGSGRQPGSVG